MAEKKKYNSILISGRKDETLTYSKYVKDEESGESVKESLGKKVNVTDELTTQQIKDGAITNEKMAAYSVGNTNLQDGSVSNEKLEAGSITNEKLAENSITKDKLQDNTIGVEKLDNELRQAIAAATGLPENLVETIQNVDDTLKDHQSQLDDKQSQIDDKQKQITANDEDISLLQTRSTQMEETIKSIAATGGASQATAVTYDNANSQLSAINIQSAVDELQVSKIDKTSIVQVSGDAEDKVMSQKAVNTRVNEIGEFVNNQEYIRAYIDNEGRILFAIKRDGTIEWSKGIPKPIKDKILELETFSKEKAKELDDKTALSAKTFKENSNNEYLYTIIDSDGRILFAIKRDGTTYQPYQTNYNIISNKEWLYAILDVDDKIIAGIKTDGTFYFKNSNSTNNSNASNAIQNGYGANFLGISDLAQLDKDINIIVMDGQSLSTGSETSMPIQTEGNDWSYMLGNDINIYNVAISSAQISKLRSGGGDIKENSIVTAVLSLTQLLANSGTPKKILAISVGQGGTTIEQLMKGAESSFYEDRFLAALNRIKELCDEQGLSVGVFGIMWMQGESNSSSTIDDYKTKLRQLHDDMMSDIRQIFNQNKKANFLMYGSFSRLFFAYNPIIAMQELADKYYDMFLANPIYNLPAYRYGHLSSNGVVWYGEYIAKAFYDLAKGVKPHVMRINDAYFINNNTIKVDIDVPVKPIVLDVVSWDKADNFGFAVYKVDTKETISSVKLLGDSIYITLTSEKDDSVYTLQYVDEKAFVPKKYGNVRDSSPYQAQYNYVEDSTEFGGTLYPGWIEIEDGSGAIPIREGEYFTEYQVGQKVSITTKGETKYYECTSKTGFPPYCYVSNRTNNVSAGDKYTMWNWLLPYKKEIKSLI